MSAEWPLIMLGEYCSKIGSGATPKGGSSVYLDQGEISLFRSQNIYNEGFSPNGLVYISSESANKLKNVVIEPNDVLINITGDSVARVCIAPENYLPARVNQHVAIIRPLPSEFDSRYIRYLLISPKMQAYLLSIASVGATRNALTKGMLESLEIQKPPLEFQKSIADILESLEDKIFSNIKMNRTLEDIAQAIFKSWFVDFEPTKAKIAAREALLAENPAAAPEQIAAAEQQAAIQAIADAGEVIPTEQLQTIVALFPNQLVDSEIGEIPYGWEIKALDQIAHYQNGLALQKFRPDSGEDFLPVLKISQLKAGFADGKEVAKASIKKECIVDNGDVIFSWSGSLVVDIWCGGKVALNQHLFKVTSNTYPKWFYYKWTKHHLEKFQQIAADKAVTMGHIKRSHLSEAKCLIPSSELLSNECISSLIDKQIQVRLESKVLSDVRDSLLPRLLAGEFSPAKMDSEHE